MSAALRIALLTLLALSAFAANSILARVALRDGAMDPLTFTVLRIASGALMLAILLKLRRRPFKGDWPSAIALVAYAAAFSVAYLSIPAGAGALLLFGAVQVTMIGTGLAQGDRPPWQEWGGVLISFSGLLLFLLPGLDRPPLAGSLLMIAAGIAWAVYSLRGRRKSDRPNDPLAATAGNFLRGLPLAVLPWLLFGGMQWNPLGVACALASGALASGLGYAVWYTVLPQLTALRASLVQLAVPVLVAAIGIVFLGEPASLRLLAGAALILGGLALATLYRPAAR
ncbi:DMT family transporter [uncultured Nevskia sp.]|uniref:DMT family transporter n=1 Tax=uncultured Nevskia sp. TaxID=228950 RepID=UPI0025E4407D|nr:DMT family transporter [uncultured Nevskia sp.]